MTSPVIERILDLARWAPSGDNTQPWRFEVLGDDQFVVHGFDTRDWCVYDLDGRASQIAIGALLENIRIAATAEGLSADCAIRADQPESTLLIDVRLLHRAGGAQADPLLPFIKRRVTQRRPLSSQALTVADRTRLEAAVGAGYRVLWIDRRAQKRAMARLLFRNAHIRLTIPEAYEVHRRIIAWDAQFSEDRIPDQAVGLDPVNRRIMRWAMRSWQRITFVNRYFAGTVLPRVMLDLVPGLRCAAHFVLVADTEPASLPDFLEGGRAMQRFWLTATALGLQLQPEMTPLIFSRYAGQHRQFTRTTAAQERAKALRNDLAALVGDAILARAVFMGRVGYGQYPKARSVRRPLEQLLKVHGSA